MVVARDKRVTEFIKFYTALMNNAPKDYEPYYFPVTPSIKTPIHMRLKSEHPTTQKILIAGKSLTLNFLLPKQKNEYITAVMLAWRLALKMI